MPRASSLLYHRLLSFGKKGKLNLKVIYLEMFNVELIFIKNIGAG